MMIGILLHCFANWILVKVGYSSSFRHVWLKSIPHLWHLYALVAPPILFIYFLTLLITTHFLPLLRMTELKRRHLYPIAESSLLLFLILITPDLMITLPILPASYTSTINFYSLSIVQIVHLLDDEELN